MRLDLICLHFHPHRHILVLNKIRSVHRSSTSLQCEENLTRSHYDELSQVRQTSEQDVLKSESDSLREEVQQTKTISS